MDNKLIIDLINIKCEEINEFSLNNIKTLGKVVDIYDGDTCKIVLVINNILYKFNCRLTGLDTPEIKPHLTKCNRETEILEAYKCRNKLIQLSTNCDIDLESNFKKKDCTKLFELNTKIITVLCHEFDKYGRLLVSLYDNDNDNQISYNDILINDSFAKKYDGKHKDSFIY